MSKSLYFLFGILLVTSPAPAQAEPPQGKFVCFGDSVESASQQNSDHWVSLLDGKREALTVIDEVKTGRQATAKLELLAALERNPEFRGVILLVGANDLTRSEQKEPEEQQEEDEKKKIDKVAECRKKIATLIDVVRSTKPKSRILICAPTGIQVENLNEAWKARGFGRSVQKKLGQLESELHQLAMEKKTEFVSLYRVVDPKFLPDGVHPIAAGHKQISETIWNALHGRTQPMTLENVIAPTANVRDEPKAAFSLPRATQFLDTAALSWQRDRKCFTCHTNYAYLLARPAITGDAPAHRQIRQALEELVEVRWEDEEKGPRWDAEVVMSAAMLALNDAATTGKLHPVTKKALTRMWTLQQEDGGFDWLKCDWPPFESDDHYGATMAAIAVGAAPGDYRNQPEAMKGMARLKSYLSENPPPTLHHRAMVLWAASLHENLLSEQEKSEGIEALLKLQKPDGGWNLASFGDWPERSDEKPQDLKTSDGYATGFTIYVLRQCGLSADHPQLQKGIAWLKANQRVSGRWFTRSLHADSKHFISHAGSAFAVLAIRACEAE